MKKDPKIRGRLFFRRGHSNFSALTIILTFATMVVVCSEEDVRVCLGSTADVLDAVEIAFIMRWVKEQQRAETLERGSAKKMKERKQTRRESLN